MWRRRVELTDQQHEALERIAKRDPKPYVRERAAAIVKVAAGAVAAQVAAHGLLTRHKPDTVYGWLDRFAAEGVVGLRIRPGRGRKPTLSPPRERRVG
jgi:transposase